VATVSNSAKYGPRPVDTVPMPFSMICACGWQNDGAMPVAAVSNILRIYIQNSHHETLDKSIFILHIAYFILHVGLWHFAFCTLHIAYCILQITHYYYGPFYTRILFGTDLACCSLLRCFYVLIAVKIVVVWA